LQPRLVTHFSVTSKRQLDFDWAWLYTPVNWSDLLPEERSMEWDSPPRPAEMVEARLITAILSHQFPIGSNLPPERELATQLGVTRPTLREALQRMARDGWLEIHQGRSTRVRDFWREGNLGVLGAIARHQDSLPPNFVPDLLVVRLALAPAYTRMAVEHDPQDVLDFLRSLDQLPDTPQAFAQADWELHHLLTVASGNPVFTLILNGFRTLYLAMAPTYFTSAQARSHSRSFYADLHNAASAQDPHACEALTRQVMYESIGIWHAAAGHTPGGQS
jgi:GntR family negative regulator for fad regulon and positive regulator of fabA